MGRILATPYTDGELMSWFDAGGNEWALNGDAYLFLDNPGRKGFKGLPPYATTILETPLTDGDTPRFTLAKARSLEVHLLVKGSNTTDYEQVRADLQAAMNPKLGDGRFRCTRADGEQREIYARYDSGFEGDESWGASSALHQEYLLRFLAHDPYFYDTAAQQLTFSASAPTVIFPITPLRLSSSGVLSSFSVYNAGDVEAYPVWVIQGPGTNPVITNSTTGKSLTLTISLGSGDTLTIDTKARTVTKQDGSNQYSALSYSSALWPLAPGNNVCSVSMSGTTTGSYVQLQYKQRYLSL